jgi:hypothetical protein
LIWGIVPQPDRAVRWVLPPGGITVPKLSHNLFCLPYSRESQLHLHLGADPGWRQTYSSPIRKNGTFTTRSRCSTPLIPL